MEQSIRAVYELLRQQAGLYRELLDLSYEKRQVIIKNDTARLDEIVRAEMKCMSKIKQAEVRREGHVRDLAGLLGLQEEGVTVLLLVDRCEGELRDGLYLTFKELTGLLKTQRELNAENQALLETQLEYSGAMIDAITNFDNPLENTYGKDGKTESGRRADPGRLNKKV